MTRLMWVSNVIPVCHGKIPRFFIIIRRPTLNQRYMNVYAVYLGQWSLSSGTLSKDSAILSVLEKVFASKNTIL